MPRAAAAACAALSLLAWSLLAPSLLPGACCRAAAAAAARALPFESQRWIDEEEWAQTFLQDLDARVLVDGEEFTPTCSCRVPPPEHSAKCYPRVVKITRKADLPGDLQPGRLVLDGRNLRKLVGDPEDLRMAEAAKHYFADIDGRSSEESLNVWGGEAGELLLALAVWDELTVASTGQPLRYTSVKKAVHSWVKFYNAPNKRKVFYIHTDTDAMAFVEDGIETLGDGELDITQPAPEMQDAVLERLLDESGRGIGCPHLANMLREPATYDVRPELVRMFLTHIFRMLWDTTEPLRKLMRVYVYHSPSVGGPSPGAPALPVVAAWVDFKVGDICLAEGKAPLFPPWSDGVSVLVNHPQAVDKLHNETALFVKGMTGGTVSSMEINPKIKAKYAKWDAATKRLLPATQGLPVFEVELSALEPEDATLTGEKSDPDKIREKREKKAKKKARAKAEAAGGGAGGEGGGAAEAAARPGGPDPRMFRLEPLEEEEEAEEEGGGGR